MQINLEGLDNVLDQIERQYGENAMNRLSIPALESAATMFKNELAKELASVPGPYRTGATVEEIDLQGPIPSSRGGYEFVIRWRGPDGRYSLIHINEWGTVKNPNPPMKGTISRTLKNVESRYYKILENELRKGLS